MRRNNIVGRGLCIIGTAVAAALFCSCERYDNDGFPSKVYFKAEGGELIISGTGSPYYIQILTYNGKGSGEIVKEDDSTIISNDWLTLHTVGGGKTMVLNAERNISKKRKLYIHFDSGPDHGEIIVVQNGKQ